MRSMRPEVSSGLEFFVEQRRGGARLYESNARNAHCRRSRGLVILHGRNEQHRRGSSGHDRGRRSPEGHEHHVTGARRTRHASLRGALRVRPGGRKARRLSGARGRGAHPDGRLRRRVRGAAARSRRPRLRSVERADPPARLQSTHRSAPGRAGRGAHAERSASVRARSVAGSSGDKSPSVSEPGGVRVPVTAHLLRKGPCGGPPSPDGVPRRTSTR